MLWADTCFIIYVTAVCLSPDSEMYFVTDKTSATTVHTKGKVYTQLAQYA